LTSHSGRTIAASARAEAERVLVEHHAAMTLPVPVDLIAERCECQRVGKRHDGTDVIVFALRSAVGDRIIGVNSSHGNPRQRFALAHALGHVRLHEYELVLCHEIRAGGDGKRLSSTASMEQERAANRFAAELLMPAGLVRRETRAWLKGADTGSDRDRLTKDLAKLFAVSYEAMAFRLVDLALIVP